MPAIGVPLWWDAEYVLEGAVAFCPPDSIPIEETLKLDLDVIDETVEDGTVIEEVDTEIPVVEDVLLETTNPNPDTETTTEDQGETEEPSEVETITEEETEPLVEEGTELPAEDETELIVEEEAESTVEEAEPAAEVAE